MSFRDIRTSEYHQTNQRAGLLDEHHLHGFREVAGLQAIEIDAAGKVCRIKRLRVSAWCQALIDQCGNLLTQNIKDFKFHIALSWHREANRGCRVKWVRIILL